MGQGQAKYEKMVVFLGGFSFFGRKDKLSGKAESSPPDLEATVLSGVRCSSPKWEPLFVLEISSSLPQCTQHNPHVPAHQRR